MAGTVSKQRPDYWQPGDPSEWDVLVNGERVGSVRRRPGTSAGYYGAWSAGRAGLAASAGEAVRMVVERRAARS